MFKKAIFVAGLAIGFVAGSAAGREPFDQIKSQVLGVTNDPEVRRVVDQGARECVEAIAEVIAADTGADPERALLLSLIHI